MRLQRDHGFTLIELLIVVAIIAIMSAASMRMIVGPMQEQAFASIEHAQQAGAATLLARLVEEAHDATALQPLENGILLEGALACGQSGVRYQVDSEGRLRRNVIGDASTQETTGSALLDDVQTFTASPATTAGLWNLSLLATQNKYGRAITLERQFMLGVGVAAWGGQEVAP